MHPQPFGIAYNSRGLGRHSQLVSIGPLLHCSDLQLRQIFSYFSVTFSTVRTKHCAKNAPVVYNNPSFPTTKVFLICSSVSTSLVFSNWINPNQQAPPLRKHLREISIVFITCFFVFSPGIYFLTTTQALVSWVDG